MKGFDGGGLNLEEREQMDRPMRDLIEIVQFMENVSAKIHGLLDEAEVYSTVKEGFVRSRKYTVSILLLTDDGSKLRFAETSLSPEKVKAGEKAAGIRLKGYTIDLNKSSIYSQVVREGKTVQVNVSDVIGELFPQPLVYLISKIMGYTKKPSILTPLKRHGKIIGALAMSSTSLAEHLIPSVRNLAQHISNALELADEHAVRKQTEEALRESERRHKELAESITETFFAMDRNLKYIYWNKASEKLTGIKAEDAIGKSIFEIFPDREDTRSAVIVYRRVLQTKQPETFVNEYQLGGKNYFFEISVYPTRDSISVFVKDITERKKAEEALMKSEEKFRSLTEATSDWVWEVDQYGVYTYASPKVLDLLGYEPEEIIGKTPFDLMPPDEAKRIAAEFGAIAEAKKTFDRLENVNLHKDGHQVVLDTSGVPILDESGNLKGYRGIDRDITERKQMKEKLRQYSEHLEKLVQKRTEELLESEKRYSVLVEEAGDGVVIIQDEKIVFTNRKALEIVGYSRDEVIGLAYEKLVDEKYRQQAKETYVLRVRGEKAPTTHEIKVITKTGERVPVELSGTLINYKGHTADLVILRDIRERKRMEEERLKLERLAAIGEIAAMMGHDLRNPLQSIENAAYYLMNELTFLSSSILIPKKIMEMLRVIGNSVNYADKIIRDLQDFSATKTPKLKKTDINMLVEETLSQVEAPENVELITEPGHLPQIKVDKDMIKRVFLNLALNGIQAMENGGRLIVSSKKTSGFVEISFKDTGVGILKENMEKLFTPFFTTKARGIGMGLPICKKFVEGHSGTIQVESEVGKGATFTVKLPITQENGGENQWRRIRPASS